MARRLHPFSTEDPIMRRTLVTLGLLALAATGCVHSSEVARRAQYHERQAHAAARAGDYRRAAEEQREAIRLRQMEEEKRFHETATAPVLRPATM
jgi:hypothetical protein